MTKIKHYSDKFDKDRAKQEQINLKITPPIKLEFCKEYLVVIKDAKKVNYYFKHDGSYDGFDKGS